MEEELAPVQVRELADAIAKTCCGLAAVLSGTDDRGYSICLIGPGAKEKGAFLTQNCNGRGGGKPDAFQGSLQAEKAQIERCWQEMCI